MSRRKQSNPKPLKLSSEEGSIKAEEDRNNEVSPNGEMSPKTESPGGEIQTEGETNLESSRNTSPMSPDTQKRDNHIENNREDHQSDNEMSDTKTMHQIKKEKDTDSPSPTALNSLATQLQLPQDVLYLKRVEITMHGNTAICWVVCCDIPLPKGSSLGPFQGEVTSADKVRVGDLILQFSGKNSPVLVNVTAQSGAWLALLRTATSNAVKNTCVHFEGDRIWCEVVSDLEKGSELIGSFLYHVENESPPSSPVPPSPIPPPPTQEEVPKPEPPPSSSSNKRSPTNHAALIFGCPFCSVRFSSPRTLQGHLAYYCSKKPPDLIEKPDKEEEESDKSALQSAESPDENGTTVVKTEPGEEDERSKVNKRPLDTSSDYSRDTESPPAKTLKTSQLFKCSHCSYSADKLSSLNRHRRIHNRPSEDGEPGNIPVCLTETFCKDCNIQFSSWSTFKGHKEFYCNKRGQGDRSEDKKDSWEESRTESSSSHSSPNSQQEDHQRGIYLPTGQLMTHSMMTTGTSSTVIPGQTAVIFAAPVVAPSEMGITMPTYIVQPVVANPAASVTKESAVAALSQVPAIAHQKTTASSKPVSCAEKPLDLSKKPPESPENEKSERFQHFPREALKIDTSRTFLKDIPPLRKIEPTSPPLSSPQGASTNSPQEKSPRASSETSPSSRSRSPDPRQQSPYLQGLTPHYLPITVPGIPPPSLVQTPTATISKCADCNIVFYKHENYMIHKEHYCSGKKSRYSSPTKTEISQKSPTSSPDTSSPVKREFRSPSAEHDKESVEPKTDGPEDIHYRFFCVPCKIKFSSSSTLKAHKEFYCPHGKDSGQTVVLQPVENQEEATPKTPTPEVVDFKCERCDSVFTTSRLLKLHLCSGDASSMPLFRCPHCDYVTQTDARLSDHMKVHAPTRAFRCSICGYRGNTVRGMRMHGKMHIDNGEEFTDDSMIEYEEPALMPIQTNGQIPHGPVDMEAELIRLKNEPYKRRRSRKSYEKSEYMISPGQLQSNHHCPVCRDTFPSVKCLNVHMKIHEMTFKYQQNLLQCSRCSYSAVSTEDLALHVKELHSTPHSSPSPNELTSPKKSPDFRPSSREESMDRSPEERVVPHRQSCEPRMDRRPQSREERVYIKQEPLDTYTIIDNGKDHSPSSPDKENIVKVENIDRSYTPKSDTSPGICASPSVRASPYPRVSPNSHLSPINTPVSPVVKVQPKSPDNSSRSPSLEKFSPDSWKGVKNGSGSHSIIFPSGPMFPYFLIPQTSAGSPPVSPELTSPKIDKGPRYCKNCDISFTYQANFVAHKKYYCTALKTTEDVSPSASA